MNQLEIYTDGSSKGRYGAWAYVVISGAADSSKIVRESSGRVPKADSNTMEFQAAIEALRVVPQNSHVTICTDSRVLIEKVEKFDEWRANNWIKSNGSPIRYVESLKTLDSLLSLRNVKWSWVKAHSGNVWNERCDELCLIARSANKLI